MLESKKKNDSTLCRGSELGSKTLYLGGVLCDQLSLADSVIEELCFLCILHKL